MSASASIYTIRGGTPLHEAVRHYREDVAENLIYSQTGVCINARDEKGWTPLHIAANIGCNSIVKTLIDCNAKVNIGNESLKSPLHFAAENGNDYAVKVLVKAGADVEFRNENGWTPLHYAVHEGQCEVMKSLIENDANVHAKDMEGWTPLHIAVQRKQHLAVEILIQNGSDVDAEDKDGWTPLFFAAKYGYIDLVKALVFAGADINMKDEDGKPLRQIATAYARQVIDAFEVEVRSAPKEIQCLGRRMIAKYLSALRDGKSVSNFIRVMLVGHFGVGKTTIALNLLERKVENIDSTDGIEVYINMCLYDEQKHMWYTREGKFDQNFLGMENIIRIDIVDFAGQLLYYTTHQTYLTSRGLYLLVFDLSIGLQGQVDDDDMYPGMKHGRRVIDFLEYWIATITTYAKGKHVKFPKIVLIGTHKDKIKDAERLQMIKQQIKYKFPDLIADSRLIVEDSLFINAVNMTDDTRRTIRDVVLKEGRIYPEFGERIPSSWNALMVKLLNLKESGRFVVTLEEIEKLQKELRIHLDQGEMDVFLRYLHNIGYILYFPSSELREKIILDPKVVIDAMKAFITCERFIAKFWKRKAWRKMRLSGRVQRSHILEMWRQGNLLGFAEHCHHLLQIMKKLDLICEPMIYKCGEKITSDFFLVPSMMNAAVPDDRHVSLQNPIEVVYVSENIIPPAIFNRLICSCLALWEIYDGHFYNGMVVLRSGRYHLIQLKRDVQRITVKFARTEATCPPDIQLCLGVKQFCSETIDRIVAVYNTSTKGPITCDSSALDDAIQQKQRETNGLVDQTDCICEDENETIRDRQLEDVEMMRIAKQLQDCDLNILCSTFLNKTRVSSRIEQSHKGFQSDVKAFYVLQEWKKCTKKHTLGELRELVKKHLKDFGIDVHEVCRAMQKQVLHADALDSTIRVCRVYPEFLSAIADSISHEYVHLGLELGISLKELERLRISKENITLDITRSVLKKWHDSQKDKATVTFVLYHIWPQRSYNAG